MTNLDPRSMIALAGFMSAVMAMVLLFMRRHYPPSIRGGGGWAAAPLLWLLPLDNVLRTGLSIIACCPAGSLAAVLAKQTGTEATLASQAVAHSTVCMLVTVPAMLLLTGAMFPM